MECFNFFLVRLNFVELKIPIFRGALQFNSIIIQCTHINIIIINHTEKKCIPCFNVPFVNLPVVRAMFLFDFINTHFRRSSNFVPSVHIYVRDGFRFLQWQPKPS